MKNNLLTIHVTPMANEGGIQVTATSPTSGDFWLGQFFSENHLCHAYPAVESLLIELRDIHRVSSLNWATDKAAEHGLALCAGPFDGLAVHGFIPKRDRLPNEQDVSGAAELIAIEVARRSTQALLKHDNTTIVETLMSILIHGHKGLMQGPASDMRAYADQYDLLIYGAGPLRGAASILATDHLRAIADNTCGSAL